MAGGGKGKQVVVRHDGGVDIVVTSVRQMKSGKREINCFAVNVKKSMILELKQIARSGERSCTDSKEG